MIEDLPYLCALGNERDQANCAPHPDGPKTDDQPLGWVFICLCGFERICPGQSKTSGVVNLASVATMSSLAVDMELKKSVAMKHADLKLRARGGTVFTPTAEAEFEFRHLRTQLSDH